MQAKKSFVFCHFSFVIIFLFLFSFILLFSSCKRSTEPLYNPQTLQLTVADVSCTEAWLNLKAQITQKDSSELKLQLYRNDSLIVNKPLTNADSVLYVDGLQPATSYSFSAKLLKNGKLQATGNRLPVTTMDTTSHNFTWQTFEFGWAYYGSSLKDVAVIDQNDIWAVGEIHTPETDRNDSLGHWIQPYNAVHWNGDKWELKKIYFHLCPNGTYLSSYPIEAVFTTNKNSIWFTEGGSIVYWDGGQYKQDCSVNKILTGGIRKIWGISNSDLYLVGTSGLIVHYDGREWRRIEGSCGTSPTDVRLLDIYGSQRGINIWACGWYDFYPTVLLNIRNRRSYAIINSDSILSPYNPNAISGGMRSLWTDDNDNLYILTWYNLYKAIKGNTDYITALWRRDSVKPWASDRVRGNAANDLVTAGLHGAVWHYNGATWKLYDALLDPQIHLYSVAMRNDIIVAVGRRYVNGIERYGVIYKGVR